MNDRYEVEGRLGGGAEGRVYRVVDQGAGGAPRALKLVTGASEAARRRLAAEFRRLSTLSHPSLTRVHDLGELAAPALGAPAGTLFFTSDLAPGRAAAELRAGAEALVAIAEDVAAALAHMHGRGLLHRDVKPDNVIVDGRGPAARAVLVDLGLSAAAGEDGAARGSLPYLSPEALAARPDARSDLYGLGATLYQLATGAAPFAGSAAELALAIAAGRRRPVSEGAPDLPSPLAELIERLLDPDPDRRPSSAAVVVAELSRVREALDLPPSRAAALPPLVPARLVGRDAEIAAVSAELSRGAGTVEVVGPAGSGRDAVAAAAVRRIQLAAAARGERPCELLRGSLDELAAAVGAEAADGVDLAEAVAAALAARAPVIAIIPDGGDPRVRLLARAVAARGVSLVRVAESAAVPGAPTVALAELAPDAIAELAAELLGAAPPAEWCAELSRVTGGQARVALEILREVAVRGGVERAPRPGALAVDAGAFADLLVRRVAALPRALAAAVEVLAVLGDGAPVEAAAELLETAPDDASDRIAELAALGLARVERGVASLPSPAHARAVAAALPQRRARALHRAALHTPAGRDPVARARHLAAAGPARAAADACAAAAEHLARQGLGDEALSLARLAAERAPGAAAAAALLAERAEAVGCYDEAARAGERAARSRDPDVRRRGLLAAARAAHKGGQVDRAEALFSRLAELCPDEAAVLGARARFSVSRGRYAEALAIAGRAAGPVLERALAVEAAGLAHFYLGDHARADDAFATLEDAAREAGDRRRLGRALALRGMLAQAGGDPAAAAERYRAAADAARRAGDLHAAAVCELNRATAESHRGRFGAALAALTEAAPDLERYGSAAERAALLFNRGNALLAVGEIDAAGRAAERARAAADEHGDALMAVHGRILAGDVARRRGDPGAAAALYDEAATLATDAALGDAALVARTSLAEARAELGDPSAAALAASLDAAGDAGARLALCRGRIALALGGDPDQPAAALEAVAAEQRRGHGLDLAWRAAALAARLRRARGERARAAELCCAARAGFDALVADAPEAFRAGMRRDPDAQALAALEADLAVSDARPARATDAGHDALRRLLALGRRLNSELRLEPLLDDVIDTAIELAGAERGFLLLEEGGELEVAIARGIDRAALGGPSDISRSIAERAARTGETIVTVDAELDDRWRGAESVVAMQLRSVLAVPLRIKSRLIGTIYVDHRFRRGAFDDAAALVLGELADIAAVAIANARLAEEARRRQEEIASLSERLAAELDRSEVELAEARARLPDGDRAARGRRFPELVGRAPAMLELFASLERAAAAALPVVVTGESGTGKELVARALHRSGPRAERAFVAVNCGAVPDQLLESELFGHRRGAFTGAERDRRGLFEVADGGTLFLDEVADTSPAMQAKLLRVLQEGEIRRLGDERVRSVDVRVVCATNRELGELVAAGSFREDLYYRLNVLELRVPPLRERIEDLADLCEHILARLAAGGAPAVLSRAALGRLAAHAWPGNVRELENELARAAALADGVVEIEHLSAHIARAAVDAPAPGGDDLRLRPKVEALERALVEEALDRAGGNQSQAARLLGLSRYGLQKKLKRYGIAGALPS